MSNQFLAFIDPAKVPTVQAWQAAIVDCGYDLRLDPELKPKVPSAFSPMTLLGKPSGVEIYGTNDRELLDDFEEIRGGREYCITFSWGGDMGECACASIASYALAKHFGALVSYEGEEPGSLEELREGADEALELFQKEEP